MEVVLIRLVRVHSFVWRLSHTSTLFLTLQPARPTGKAWLLFCFKSYSRGRRLFRGNSCISEVISRIVTRDIETWVCPLLTVEQVLFSSHLLCGFFYQGTFPNHSREVIIGMCPNILTRSCPYRCRQTVVRTNEKEKERFMSSPHLFSGVSISCPCCAEEQDQAGFWVRPRGSDTHLSHSAFHHTVREMTKLVECLLRKHEDVSSNPQKPCKRATWQCVLATLTLRGIKTHWSLRLTAQSA